MESLSIQYLIPIAIKNKRTNKYLSHHKTQNIVNCAGTHPINNAKIPRDDLQNNETFLISNYQKKELKGTLVFGSQVYIQNEEGQLLISTNSGELKFEKLDEKIDQITQKNAKWSIIDSHSKGNRKQIFIYDDVIFQSAFGNYIICENNEKLSANGPNISDDSSWRIQPAETPAMPIWLYIRPNMQQCQINDQFQLEKQNFAKKEEVKSFSTNSPQIQELYLIEDLMFAMMSVEGVYIKKKYDQQDKNIYQYALEVDCYKSIFVLMNKILPICTYHDRIQNFISLKSQFSEGRVSQALCAGIKLLLREYLVMVNQLDSEFRVGELNLQKLWFYVQPTMKIIEALLKLTVECEIKKGGLILQQLFLLINSTTDKQIIQIYGFLLQKSFVPYIEIFQKWIYSGEIDDLYGEFLIKEQKNIDKQNKSYKDSYWDQKFVLNENQIPQFLAKLDQMILKTGKYLNVMKLCDRLQECPFSQDLYKNYENYIQIQDFSQPVLKANEWANGQVINMIMNEEDLLTKLSSIKNFFLFGKADYFVHFIDSAEEELKKNVSQVSKEKLESLLEMSIRTSSLANDAYFEDFTCSLEHFTLLESVFAIQMANKNFTDNIQKNIYTPAQNIKGFEVFTLEYKVKWPLNLIISQKAITKYKILFRHLFCCKYVERQLCQSWLHHQSIKEYNIQKKFLASFALTQRMIHFSKNLIYNYCYEVLEQQWIKFMNQIKNVLKFDDILQLHDQFLNDCMKECMILDNNILTIIQNLNDTCRVFSNVVVDFFKPLSSKDSNVEVEGINSIERRKIIIKMNCDQLNKIIAEQGHKRTVQNFDQKFNQFIQKLVTQIGSQQIFPQQYYRLSKYDSYLVNFMTRLDLDGFYYNFLSKEQEKQEKNIYFKK